MGGDHHGENLVRAATPIVEKTPVVAPALKPDERAVTGRGQGVVSQRQKAYMCSGQDVRGSITDSPNRELNSAEPRLSVER